MSKNEKQRWRISKKVILLDDAVNTKKIIRNVLA
uniref:Uncharacterized protein n=1 Tax=viral metagenome TaxID=1070528 RepID=A0A6C0DLA8_9ZZZZ